VRRGGLTCDVGGLGFPVGAGLLALLDAIAEIHVDQALIGHLVLFRELLEIDEAAVLDADGDGLLQATVIGVTDALHLGEVVVVTHGVFVVRSLSFPWHRLSSR
jgi:hypothetical protein